MDDIKRAINRIKQSKQLWKLRLQQNKNDIAAKEEIKLLDVAILALENLKPWIPVAEVLPEKDGDYLVSMIVPGYIGGNPHTGWLCWDCGENVWTDTDGNLITDTIIAWRPIPEPYQSDN